MQSHTPRAAAPPPYLFEMYSPSDMGWSVVEEGVAEEVGGVSVEVESLVIEVAERLSLMEDHTVTLRHYCNVYEIRAATYCF